MQAPQHVIPEDSKTGVCVCSWCMAAMQARCAFFWAAWDAANDFQGQPWTPTTR